MSTVSLAALVLLAASWLAADNAAAQTSDDVKLAQAAKVLHDFTTDEKEGIPIELLQRAHGVVVIPNLIRGGFFVGGRRGRGVLIVRTPSGGWSNPAFVTLTGGSIGWQFGAESADVVLVLANERSVRNIKEGKFTFGGDAAAVAGPAGRRTTAAVTAKSEVYIYAHGRGLFAGAAVEGARLDVDQDGSAAFYAADKRAAPLGEQSAATPASARTFLEAVDGASAVVAAARPPSGPERAEEEGVKIYPLGEAPP
ncbi:MAG TPA: lipid-binding SYLF domain-containing protein [Gammaproteobacteria bacterium]|nr:lipid-binding SYLF domain-containing protein [Gammaproteobacteria bacterium]